MKLEKLWKDIKLSDLLKKKEKTPTIVIVLAVIGCIALIAAIAFAVYKIMTPDYLDDFEDDFDDDFDEDFFDEEEEAKMEKEAEASVIPANAENPATVPEVLTVEE